PSRRIELHSNHRNPAGSEGRVARRSRLAQRLDRRRCRTSPRGAIPRKLVRAGAHRIAARTSWVVKVTETNIPGVVIIEPNVFPDTRGSFRTVFHADDYASAGVEHRFVQDNVSESHRGVLRGLHFQHPEGQGKLVYVTRGEIFDV